MKFDPEKHHRHSIRLRGYDYAQPGAYFVTLYTQNRDCLLGEVIDGQMALNPFGEMVEADWRDLSNYYPHVRLDAFVVMPNHVHGVIRLTDPIPITAGSGGFVVGAGFKPAPRGTCTDTGMSVEMNTGMVKRRGLPEIIRGFKTFSSRRINQFRNTPGRPVWQRNYYERIVRNQRKLSNIRQYILNNPQNWAEDADNTQNFGLSLGK